MDDLPDLTPYVEMLQRINDMSDEELDVLVTKGECPYQPELLKGQPIGMHHCRVCGEMVVAGLLHPGLLSDEELEEVTEPNEE